MLSTHWAVHIIFIQFWINDRCSTHLLHSQFHNLGADIETFCSVFHGPVVKSMTALPKVCVWKGFYSSFIPFVLLCDSVLQHAPRSWCHFTALVGVSLTPVRTFPLTSPPSTSGLHLGFSFGAKSPFHFHASREQAMLSYSTSRQQWLDGLDGF